MGTLKGELKQWSAGRITASLGDQLKGATAGTTPRFARCRCGKEILIGTPCPWCRRNSTIYRRTILRKGGRGNGPKDVDHHN